MNQAMKVLRDGFLINLAETQACIELCLYIAADRMREQLQADLSALGGLASTW